MEQETTATTSTGQQHAHLGELAIRNGTARLIVTYMKTGMTPEEASTEALQEMLEMEEKFIMNVLAFDPEGNITAASTYREPSYHYRDIDSEKVETRTGIWVKQ